MQILMSRSALICSSLHLLTPARPVAALTPECPRQHIGSASTVGETRRALLDLPKEAKPLSRHRPRPRPWLVAGLVADPPSVTASRTDPHSASGLKHSPTAPSLQSAPGLPDPSPGPVAHMRIDGRRLPGRCAPAGTHARH